MRESQTKISNQDEQITNYIAKNRRIQDTSVLEQCLLESIELNRRLLDLLERQSRERWVDTGEMD